MKILFVADGRSPTALNWLSYFVETGHQVHLASMFPCKPDLNLSSLHIINVPILGVGDANSQEMSGNVTTKTFEGLLRKISTPKLRTLFRQLFVPNRLPQAAMQLRALITNVRPDLIHAMRIPYEAMLTTIALTEHSKPFLQRTSSVDNNTGSGLAHPFIVSVWGNDFTLHAGSTRLMTMYTHQVLARADALHTDCQRDVNLAHAWGFPVDRKAIVLPGGGGVQLEVFHTVRHQSSEQVYVINPRGFRSYIRNDTFFRAIPIVLKQQPKVRFICPAMADEPRALRWINEYGISSSVELLPKVPRTEMGELFRKSQIVVSPSTHDGTPNTLLEAMACGCFPIVGDIESLREWIKPGANGLLIDPADPAALAQAILIALGRHELRLSAADINTRLISERAEYRHVMMQAEMFYRQLL